VYMLQHFVHAKFAFSHQQYFSSAYTRSGFLRDDMYIVLTALALTLVYTLV